VYVGFPVDTTLELETGVALGIANVVETVGPDDITVLFSCGGAGAKYMYPRNPAMPIIRRNRITTMVIVFD